VSAEIRSAYLEAANAAAELLGRRELGDRWDDQSVLEGYTIGTLAGHVARAVLTVHWYLDMPEPEPPLLTAGQYYAERAWGDSNTDAAETARGGWARIYLDVGRAVGHLEERLPDEPAGHRIPAHAKALLIDEYLRTRIVELVIHLEDLTRSLDLPKVELPASEQIAIDVLMESAVLRHGAAGVLHALARRELDEVDALRVL
jgi:hypothetical protein